jgi:hypothetical protein
MIEILLYVLIASIYVLGMFIFEDLVISGEDWNEEAKSFILSIWPLVAIFSVLSIWWTAVWFIPKAIWNVIKRLDHWLTAKIWGF